MQLQQDVRVTVRVDKELKENAEKLFTRLGMNMSVAFNVFLRKAVDEQAIPFDIRLGITDGSKEYSTDMITAAFRNQVAEEIAANLSAGAPVALYDEKIKEPYLYYPDGRREYVIDKAVPTKRPRSELCGILKGKVWMADDFDAPLEDMQEYME